MKSMKYFALLAVVATLTLGAFAKGPNEGKFTLSDNVQLGSTQLKAGDYKATWEGTGVRRTSEDSEGQGCGCDGSGKAGRQAIGPEFRIGGNRERSEDACGH